MEGKLSLENDERIFQKKRENGYQKNLLIEWSQSLDIIDSIYIMIAIIQSFW